MDAVIDPASGRAILSPDAQAALRARRARLRGLMELFADEYWEQDEHYRFVLHTGAIIGSERTGDAGSILGKTLWELPAIVASDDEWVKHKAELAAQWSFCEFEYAVVLADGQRGYYSISGEPLYDEAGALVGFHGTGLDITRRKRAAIAFTRSWLIE